MSAKNKIRNLKDLSREKARVRKSIREQEKIFSKDMDRIIESVSPSKIITEVAGKLLTSAPALYTAYTIIRSLFGRKKKDDAQ